jgi:hypothetical protein
MAPVETKPGSTTTTTTVSTVHGTSSAVEYAGLQEKQPIALLGPYK